MTTSNVVGCGLSARDYEQESVFTAANLMREARRQRNLPEIDVPEVCLLDPDGEWSGTSPRRATPDVTPGGPATTPSGG